MCGIVGYIGNKKAVPVLINGLLSLEYRGYDSAGVAVLNPKETGNKKTNNKHSNYDLDLKIVKDKGRVKNLEENPELSHLVGSIGIAHTRWATHGMPSPDNAHPHYDNNKQFAVVHNGIIENYDELRSFLLENKYFLYSETDTEVIPNLINYFYDKINRAANKIELSSNEDINKILKKIPDITSKNKNTDKLLLALSLTIKVLKGSYAIEVISPLFPDEIMVAKKDSPMVIGAGKDENFIASDIPAVLNYTKKFYFMEDNELAVIKNNSISFYNSELKAIKKELKDIEWDAIASDKNGYDDYMLKEIFEQPNAILETIGTSLSGSSITLPIKNVNFSKFNKIYIVACGTAMHAGIAAKYTFEKFCNIPTEIDIASEFRYRNPLIDNKTLCIFISQSGETADTIAALKLSKAAGSTTIAIVNAIGSSITRISDFVLYTHAGPEIAVASTKAYTCQVVLLNILALYIAQSLINAKTSKFSDNKKAELNKEIKLLKGEIISLPQKINDTLKCVHQVKSIAKKIYTKKDMFFIGRGSDYAVALEGSLKLKEISYIHSEANAAGELKHGPIALIEKGVPVIGIATSPDLTLKTISNLEEVITRGAEVILVTNQDINNEAFKTIINIPECISIISPILSVIPLQIFAYYIAKNKKLDVDKPRNLAKSVTVE